MTLGDTFSNKESRQSIGGFTKWSIGVIISLGNFWNKQTENLIFAQKKGSKMNHVSGKMTVSEEKDPMFHPL